MTNRETMKCLWCKRELTIDDIVIGSGWAYCKNCKKPMLDVSIQSPEHFLKRNEKKIEHNGYIELMMKGYM